MIHKIINWFRHRRFFVIADANDNSITFSRALFKQLNVMDADQAKVFVFWVPQNNCYAFMLNPCLDQPTQLADIQYNGKYHSIGFECLVPTVNRIFYDYRLPHGSRCKLSVERHTANDITFYKICRPHEKIAQ